MLIRISVMAVLAVGFAACSPNALILESSVMGPIGTNGDLPTGPSPILANAPTAEQGYIIPGYNSRIGLPNGDYAVPPPIALDNSALIAWSRTTVVSKEQRNLYQTELMRRSDQLCTYYLSRLYLVRGGANLAAETGIAVVDAVGTLFTSLYAINFFSSINKGLTGSRKTLQDEFLAQEFMSRATSQITSDRDNLRTIILSNQNSSLEDYPLSRAIYDVTEYHNRCNIFQAASRMGNNQTPFETRPESTTNAKFMKKKNGG